MKQYTINELQIDKGLTLAELSCFIAIDSLNKRGMPSTTAGIMDETQKERGWVWNMCRRLYEKGLIQLPQPGVQVPTAVIVTQKKEVE